ncbi:MAG: CopG family transcriptional regulator [Caulobacteraceae bacterium]
MSYHLSVYLDDDLHAALQDFAARRGKSLSIVAAAAIASFLSPDSAERQEAVLARRLDRLSRQFERFERDQGISVEMLALFVRFWLAATPPVPEAAQTAARAKGQERYQGFVDALGRRIAAGKLFTREVSFDQTAIKPVVDL